MEYFMLLVLMLVMTDDTFVILFVKICHICLFIYCKFAFYNLDFWLFVNMADDEDEGGFGGLYEDGHWGWDDISESLVFIR